MSSFGQGISLSLEIYLFLTPMVLTQLFKLKVAKDAYLLAKAPPDLRNPDRILRGSCHRGARWRYTLALEENPPLFQLKVHRSGMEALLTASQ